MRSLRIIIFLIISFFFLIHASISLVASIGPGDPCNPADPARRECEDKDGRAYSCLPAEKPTDTYTHLCQLDAFGKVKPPPPLAKLLDKDSTGAGVISHFLSNFVVLIFSVAGVVLILMIVWGAFDWIISEGDKEKVASARSKIINAIIGIILFSIAFAIIQVLGTFTGFEFFKGP